MIVGDGFAACLGEPTKESKDEAVDEERRGCWPPEATEDGFEEGAGRKRGDSNVVSVVEV